MTKGSDLPSAREFSALLDAVRARTPARILVDRAGPSYRTITQLELRRDHAAALDAVHAEIEMKRDLGLDLVERFRLFEVQTRAGSKQEYLLRPDLGRRLEDAARELIRQECPAGCVLQVAIGDGLSAAAVTAQAPTLLRLLDEEARHKDWTFGRPFFIRHCRVGILNDIGDILASEVGVLLIGERPGLATAESLSAYLAYRPRSGHTDAQRNLISNIHARGVGHKEAARRIMALADQMRCRQTSGFAVKEELAALPESVNDASQKRLDSPAQSPNCGTGKSGN
jgi:ethanolamine ammonia-lyase small subunit